MKHILLLTFLFCSVSLSAQSLIVTTEGNPITGYEVEVTSSGVFYKVADNVDSPFVKLDKSNVLMIRHADGSVVNLSGSTVPNTTSTTQNSDEANEKVIQKEMNTDDYLDHEYNKIQIESHNTPMIITFQKESDKNKKIHSIAYQYYATEDSQFASKDLIVGSYVWTVANKYSGIPVGTRFLSVVLKNTSNKTIYIDLANTFYVINGKSKPYYTPGAVSSTSGGTTGVSVNLGGITNAMGIGGAVGAIARGINVGGAKSNSSTSITYSQRIISIPPNTTQNLEDIELDLKRFEYSKINKVGESIEWEESTSPHKYSIFTTYSYSEDFAEKLTLNFTKYMKKSVGIAGPNYDTKKITYKKGETIIIDPRIKVERYSGITINVPYPYKRK